MQPLQVVHDRLFGGALGGRAHDHAVPGRLHLLQDRLQALALVVAEPPADAGEVLVRGEHEVATGQRDLGREPGALAAHRVLRDLDHHGLARLQHVLDARRRPLEVLGPVVHLAGVQHAVAATADVDERRLHTGKHVLDAAQVDVADHRGRALAGHVVLDQHVFLEHGDLVALAMLGDHHQLVGEARRHDRGLATAAAVSAGAAPAAPDAAGGTARGHLLLDGHLLRPAASCTLTVGFDLAVAAAAPLARLRARSAASCRHGGTRTLGPPAGRIGGRVVTLGFGRLRLRRRVDPALGVVARASERRRSLPCPRPLPPRRRRFRGVPGRRRASGAVSVGPMPRRLLPWSRPTARSQMRSGHEAAATGAAVSCGSSAVAVVVPAGPAPRRHGRGRHGVGGGRAGRRRPGLASRPGRPVRRRASRVVTGVSVLTRVSSGLASRSWTGVSAFTGVSVLTGVVGLRRPGFGPALRRRRGGLGQRRAPLERGDALVDLRVGRRLRRRDLGLVIHGYSSRSMREGALRPVGTQPPSRTRMERAVLGDVVVSVPALRSVPRAGPRARSRTRYVLVRRSRSALLAWWPGGGRAPPRLMATRSRPWIRP